MANQRENFESAIMRSLYGQMGTPEELFRRDADGDCYTSSVIQSAWWGYQMGAAAAAKAPQAAPAYKARDAEDIRQAFEDSLSIAFGGPESALAELCKRDPNGDYSNQSVQSCWRGYKVGDMLKTAQGDEGDRQLILLALANLALLRPGFDHALRTLAGRFGVDGGGLFEHFKDTNRDQVAGQQPEGGQ